ncbi:WhiB family transcriptional regulator [Streptomyces sp. NPDC085929]|uniref:WhiB family transcriptional regulator n=1 Tax=Streptomyces sp. NPDC085929 TaxID=3365739 RepID=UPI0037D1482B
MITHQYGPHRAPDTTPRAKDWRDDALCRRARRPDFFFPTGTGSSSYQLIEDAKAFCRTCPVARDCAVWAIQQHMDDGVWGALDADQRRRLARRLTPEQLADPALIARLARQRWLADTEDPYFAAYARRTEQEDDGHVRWTIQSSSIVVCARVFTPAQLAIWLGRGRPAVGKVVATCGRSGCVAPEHVADDIIRRNRDRAAA